MFPGSLSSINANLENPLLNFFFFLVSFSVVGTTVIPTDNEQKEIFGLFFFFNEKILFLTDEPKTKETRSLHIHVFVSVVIN